MAYNQKQNQGRGDMPKTGRDIPLNMKSPVYQKAEAHVPGYKPLDKKYYFSDKKDLAGQVLNVANKQAYKRDSVAHREADLRLNKLKRGSKVPDTKYVIDGFNSKTNSFEAREKGTLNKVSISRRRMVNKLKPTYEKYYELEPKKIERFSSNR